MTLRSNVLRFSGAHVMCYNGFYCKWFFEDRGYGKHFITPLSALSSNYIVNSFTVPYIHKFAGIMGGDRRIRHERKYFFYFPIGSFLLAEETLSFSCSE